MILIVGVGLGVTIRDAWGQLQADPGQWQLWQRLPWGWLMVAAACYAVGLLPTACYWHRVLRAFGQPVSCPRAVAAHLLGHLGKYVPGKAMVVVMRTTAIRGPGVQMPVAAAAVFVESLTMMASGATLSGVLIAVQGEHPGVTRLAAVVALLVAVPTLPPLFRQLVRLIARGKLTASVAQIDEAICWRLFFAGWAWMLLTWTFLGASFAAIVQAVGEAQQAVDPAASGIAAGDLVLAAAAMALAIVAGFVSLLPGGAGVREWILAAVLAPRIGPAGALLAAVVARLVFLAVELILAAVSRWSLRP